MRAAEWFAGLNWGRRGAVCYLALAAFIFGYVLVTTAWAIYRRSEPFWGLYRLAPVKVARWTLQAGLLMAAFWPLLALPAFNGRHKSMAARLFYRFWPEPKAQ